MLSTDNVKNTCITSNYCETIIAWTSLKKQQCVPAAIKVSVVMTHQFMVTWCVQILF